MFAWRRYRRAVTDFSSLRYETDGRKAYITLDRPERLNAIDGAMPGELRSAVERADSLVAETMQRLAEMFADERTRLEGQWDRGDNVTTEDLRVALQRYRAFFDRLLNV